MSGNQHPSGRGKLIAAAISIAALLLLLVWLEGGFERKVAPGQTQAETATPAGGSTIRVAFQEMGERIAWPGTVISRTEAAVAPKLAARIEAILVRPGDRVQQGQVLVRLDDRDLQARMRQARAALAAAQSEAMRYRLDARRAENLFAREAATQQMLDAARSAATAADARVREANSGIEEISALFSETALTAPFDGVVVKRLREPGDTALPGAPVLTLLEPERLRVEAAVPEHCAGRLRIDEALAVRSGESAASEIATVDEIAPQADPQTHTVLVKAQLADSSSLQPGAFVWVEQSCGTRRVLTIPATAVIRSGQLEMVRLRRDGRTVLRHVRTGKRYGERVEILAGLREGDVVLTGAP